jgi:hypothetical protein
MAWNNQTSRRVLLRVATVTTLASVGVVAFAPRSANRVQTDATPLLTTVEPSMGGGSAAAHSPQPDPTTRATRARVSTTTAAAPKPTQPSPTTHDHHSMQPSATTAAAPVAAATTPTTTATVVHGGSTHGGVYCNGWITRVAPASHLTVYDSTNGRVPNATDCANAKAFYNRAVSANAKYADINVAKANNFRRGGDPPSQYAQHYVNWNKTPGVADATNPEGLVYHFDASGHATLIGIYFFEKGGPLTQPAGPLTIWHSHSPTAARMLHVWTFPGVRDPFALMLNGAR